jgi:putative membrane protein
MNDWGWMGGWGWWMGVGWLVLVALLILIVWTILSPLRRGPSEPWEHETRSPREPSALEILERRYARGELSDEQFERMRQRLQRPGDGR